MKREILIQTLSVFYIRLNIISCQILLRVLLIMYRGAFWYMEHRKKMKLVFKILDIMWDLCNKMFA